MTTKVYSIKIGTPGIKELCQYSVEPKKALIAFLRQQDGDYHTWDYPDNIKGIRESLTKEDHWYYDDIKNKRIIAAYPA